MSKSGVYTVALPESADLTVGRGEDCDIRVDDRKVSRVHAILKVGGKFRLIDTGSTNGTVVGARRLEQNEAVDPSVGDMITLGSTVLVLQSVVRNDPPARVPRSSSARATRPRPPRSSASRGARW